MKFVRGDVHFKMLTTVGADPALRFDFPTLGTKLDFSINSELIATGKVFKDDMAALSAKKNSTV